MSNVVFIMIDGLRPDAISRTSCPNLTALLKQSAHPGYELKSAITLLDTAPTLARLLGITAHVTWEGTCIEEIFA
jgi:predicted AlkP superfamily pyrophosphatase or phosphodiesterase